MVISTRAEIVTLAACESARGERFRGAGVIGFPQVFLANGASAVIGSLWSADERASARFMKRLYQEVTRGAGAGAAMRLARKELRESQDTSHPYYWAQFILVGEGR